MARRELGQVDWRIQNRLTLRSTKRLTTKGRVGSHARRKDPDPTRDDRIARRHQRKNLRRSKSEWAVEGEQTKEKERKRATNHGTRGVAKA